MEEEIEGTLGNDVLNGTNGDDRITPFSGNDTIDGDDGSDTVVLFGTHADFIIVQNPDGSFTITDTEEAADNQGINTLTNIEQIEFTRTGLFTPAQLLALQTTAPQTITGTTSPENLSGSLGDDTIIADDGADSLYGGPGFDRLNSGAGNDFINGGIDNDTLILTGEITDYTITQNANTSVTITDNRQGPQNQGQDTVFNVEQIEFTSNQSISVADWVAGGQTTPIFSNITGTVQFIFGTPATEAFVINGRSTDFAWASTLDAAGIVVWQGADFDILTDIEQIWFNDGIVEQATNGTFTFTPYNFDPTPGVINLIQDDPAINQTIAGSSAIDAFVIDGVSTAYGWGETTDGLGIVVWQGDTFDILNNVEQIQFNDGVVERQMDGSLTFTPTATGETGVNTITNDNTQNENIVGTERPDVFVIDGLSTDFGWGETIDGEGIVVWQGAAFDILNGVEQLSFTNGTVTQLEDDTFVFAETSEIMDLSGDATNNTLVGDNANDTLTGAGGNDMLTGGAGLDRFVASTINGDDTVLDFENGYDLFDFSNHNSVTEFSHLTIVQDLEDARISFDGGSFTLNDTTIDTLTFSDFLFA